MITDWQTWMALACVAAAATGVAMRLRGWIAGSRALGCGSSCQSCPAKKPDSLVQIQLKK